MSDDAMIPVPASLIEDIHYHLRRYNVATDRANAGHHLVELHDKVSDLASWHPSYDGDTGTLGWERARR